MKKIKIIYFLFVLLFFLPLGNSCQNLKNNDTIYIVTWNVENLFDAEDDPLKNDSEFLPNSKKEWTEDKLETKLINLMRVINYMNNSCGPDIIAMQEVENINVVKQLIYKFPERDYIVVHRESPDDRGIDASLIYDRNIFGIVSVDTIRVKLPTNSNTRYILHVTLHHKLSNSNLHIFVNHWPSRIGGQFKSEPNREAAAKTLRTAVDSLFNLNENEQIIILGDFNDEPENISIKEILRVEEFDCEKENFTPKTLFNLAYNKYKLGEGTYLYGSDWNMLDQIIISSSLVNKKNLDYVCNSFEIIKPSYMINKTGNRIGAPIPTYSGNKYIGGFSDHFPVGAKFILKNERE